MNKKIIALAITGGIIMNAAHGYTPAQGGYHIANKGNGKAEILIYEDIGDGWLGGISAKRFAEDLRDLGSITEINVRINSAGGSVFDGIAIYNTLRNHGARITVDVDGLAASIASIVAMAGDDIRMAANATMMIHNPWGVFAGDATALREQADLLDKVRGQLLATYMGQTGALSDEAKLSTMMDAETWLTAEEALAHGLITDITNEVRMAAHPDVSKFKNAPKSLLQAKNVIQQKGQKPPSTDASVKLGKMAAKINAMNL